MVRLLVAAALCVSSVAAAKEGIGKMSPTTAMALLGGRLSAKMPVKAFVEARGRSIMAADEPVAEETRVVVEAGAEKMVIMAYELFAKAGPNVGDFAAAAAKHVTTLTKPAPAIAPFTVADAKLRALSLTPAALDLTREAILIYGIYVAQPDDTVQLVVFYLNPAAAKSAAACTALAQRIAASIEGGKAVLPLAGGDKALSDGVSIKLPANYVATRMDGPDFTVHRIRKLVHLGDEAPVLGVYFGNHPAYHHKRAASDGSGSTITIARTAGRLFGKPMQWDNWERDGVSTREAIVPLSQLQAHVFFAGPTTAANDELQKVAETLHL